MSNIKAFAEQKDLNIESQLPTLREINLKTQADLKAEQIYNLASGYFSYMSIDKSFVINKISNGLIEFFNENTSPNNNLTINEMSTILDRMGK